MNYLLNTVKHLTYKQIYWQVYFRLKADISIGNSPVYYKKKNVNFKFFPLSEKKLAQSRSFHFLNLEKVFDGIIDWNYSGYGKLWTYNLEYFDYLNQVSLRVAEKRELIEDFYKFSLVNNRKLEPYPVSLRTINIIKFVTFENLNDASFLDYTYQELSFLNSNYEFHILGNHLLENCFAMLLGSVFFNEVKWRSKAERLLVRELEAQILSDGAHFELSPMYHQIILYRVLELIDWYSLYDERDENLLNYLKDKCSLMLSWLGKISFKDGSMPLFNDSANNITYTKEYLFAYADKLNILDKGVDLGESGYRSYCNDTYEIKIDFAQVGASYQPGHAHADALSFLMHYKGKPLFIEGGTSTYEIGLQRSYERSTKAHNTVEVGGTDQSEVWSGFRVGKRARTCVLVDNYSLLKAYHDGYYSEVGNVFREYKLSTSSVEIYDYLEKGGTGIFYLHLDSEVEVSSITNNIVKLSNGVCIVFSAFINLEVKNCKHAIEFNKYKNSDIIVVTFVNELRTMISL